jgi:protein-tyrosine kinase
LSLVEKVLRKMQSAQAVSELATPSARRTIDATTEEARGHGAPAPAVPVREQVLPAARTDKVITVDHKALRDAGLRPAEAEERRRMAEYRQIKRPLIAAAKGKGMEPLPNGRVIMVASALPAEGKTFTSINLSLSMALENDTTVLLADGDFAKSHLSRVFGVEHEPGLMEVLADEGRDVASVIIPTSVRGLSFLPAGNNSATATELLASGRMERVIADLLSRDPNRIVLFDSPPLLLTTESRALTSVVGQIVVVVRAEETAHNAVLDALRHISGDKSIGLVLNQCVAAPAHSYYGYGEYGETSGS